MSHRASIVVVLCLSAIATTQAQVPTYRVSTNLVPVPVTVTDAAGRFVTDLGPGDFQLFENGVPQDVVVFDHARAPVALELLIDASGSMEPYMASARRAAEALLSILRPTDVGAVFAFSSQARTVGAFTSDVSTLRDSLRSISAYGSTTLFDALYVALDQGRRFVRRMPEVPRRQVIVVVSDGADTGSRLKLEDVLDRLRESGVVVYAIRPRPDQRSRDPDEGRGQGEYILRQIAGNTGGRAFFVRSGGELEEAYEQIGRELTSQYVLAYTAPPNRERWRRINVRVNREGTTIRMREGYAAR